MPREIIDGTFDPTAGAQLLYVFDEKRGVHGSGMIEILFRALFRGQMREIFIIMVLLDDENAAASERAGQTVRDCRFAGACPAADADDERPPVHRARLPPFLASFSSITA